VVRAERLHQRREPHGQDNQDHAAMLDVAVRQERHQAQQPRQADAAFNPQKGPQPDCCIGRLRRFAAALAQPATASHRQQQHPHEPGHQRSR
jgi:Tfp pilus assembly protein PilE